MKIVAICGSPKRGNTYNILRMLKQSNPEIDFKILMLSELDLKDCFGCYSCINTGEENCPLKDDRDLIIDGERLVVHAPVDPPELGGAAP